MPRVGVTPCLAPTIQQPRRTSRRRLAGPLAWPASIVLERTAARSSSLAPRCLAPPCELAPPTDHRTRQPASPAPTRPISRTRADRNVCGQRRPADRLKCVCLEPRLVALQVATDGARSGTRFVERMCAQIVESVRTRGRRHQLLAPPPSRPMPCPRSAPCECSADDCCCASQRRFEDFETLRVGGFTPWTIGRPKSLTSYRQ